MRVRSFAAAAAVAVVVVTGCTGSKSSTGGGGGGGVDVSQFPSASELAALAARPLPPPAERTVSATNHWTFVGPFDDHFSDVAVDALTAVEQPYFAKNTSLKPTKAGRCIARELAHFLVETGAVSWPDGRWSTHVAARCGSTAQARHTMANSLSKIGKATDAAVLAQFHATPDTAVGFSGDGGVAFARKGDFAVVVAVELQPEVRLEPTSMKAENGVVVLRGSLVDGNNAELVDARVNQGDTNVVTCERDAKVALPAFALSCPVLATDDVAGVAVSVGRRGRFLSDTVGVAIALPGAPTSLEWSASLWGAATPLPTDDAALSSALVERANGIRSAASLPPLQIAPTQTATAMQLAPHYFDDGSDGVIDQVALGMLAGWNLTTPVRDGDFSSFSVNGASLDEVLGAALDSPTVRAVLLAKDAGITAVGVRRSGGSVGVIVTTWEPWQVVAPAVTQARVFDALKAERTRRGLSALGEVGLEATYVAGSTRLQGGEDANSVLHSLLSDTVDAMQRPFQGWWIETVDPEHIAWPDELLTAQPTYIAVSAGMRQKKNSPWATTVVVIVAFVDSNGGTVAMR